MRGGLKLGTLIRWPGNRPTNETLLPCESQQACPENVIGKVDVCLLTRIQEYFLITGPGKYPPYYFSCIGC